ncbi:MAPEG family protein [Amaricoccus sp. W119]|uniref:MAPEG family protein n=1 Tax=Amaricoccus sp. W119 TaxID=3391833 RepID=UPI0039A50EDD
MPQEEPQGLLIVGFYASLLGFVLCWLALAAGRARSRAGVLIGDGGDAYLTRTMRGQANFTEYTPFGLILLAIMALLGAPAWELHALGLCLTLGRALHAAHFTRASAPAWQRAGGTLLTFLALFAASAGLLYHALPRIF